MSRYAFFFAISVGLLSVGSMEAQDPDYVLTLEGPATAAPGAVVLVNVRYENLGAPASGLQYGVCHDTGVLTFNGDAGFGVDGAALDTTFAAVTNQGSDGYTVGILLNVITGETFGTGDDLPDVTNSTYTADGAGAVEFGTALVEFCDTLGSPSVVTAVVVAGSDVTPTQNSYSGPIVPPSFDYFFALGEAELNLDFDTGSGSGEMVMSIEESSFNDDFPNDTQGFQFGVEYDAAAVEATGVSSIGALSGLSGGAGPAFFGVNLTPGLPVGASGGVTLGVVYSLMGGVSLAYDGATDVVSIEFDVVPFGVDPATTLVSFRDDLGDPMLPTSVVVGGNSFLVTGSPGGFIVIEDSGYLRGDCNDDAIVNIADGIWILNELFLAGPPNDCEAACDANDDSVFDQTDAIYIFNYQSFEGPPPPTPFPDCGFDDGICDAFESCL